MALREAVMQTIGIRLENERYIAGLAIADSMTEHRRLKRLVGLSRVLLVNIV
jgi:hypothetical protein